MSSISRTELGLPGRPPADGHALAPSSAAGAGGRPAIETFELSRHYGRTVALAGLTMRVEAGEVFGFLGPNGAGKTTAIKLLLGLTRPTSGGGTLLEAPLGDRGSRRWVGYLPELFRYQPWLRAREVLDFHLDLLGLPSRGRHEEIRSGLEQVGLAGRDDDLVGTFSKGMQQRLGLAVALLGQPRIVLLDEPTSALDPVGRSEVRQIIRDLRARGTTVFLNSHLLSEVERTCDRVAVVDRGRVIMAGRLEDLLSDRSVRLRVTDLAPADEASLGRYGSLSRDGGWLVLRALDSASIPDLVAEIVGRGGRVHAVVPAHESLEERFLALLGGDSVRAEDRPS